MNNVVINRLKENSTYLGLVVLGLLAHKYIGVQDIKDAVNFADFVLALLGVTSVALPDEIGLKAFDQR